MSASTRLTTTNQQLTRRECKRQRRAAEELEQMKSRLKNDGEQDAEEYLLNCIESTD